MRLIEYKEFKETVQSPVLRKALGVIMDIGYSYKDSQKIYNILKSHNFKDYYIKLIF